MNEFSILSDEPRHLFVVAGYPTSGKTSALMKGAHSRFPLFGAQTAAIIPSAESLGGIGEQSDTAAKLAAGMWLTLTDLRRLDRDSVLPARVILHLDLLLAYVLYRAPGPANLAPRLTDEAFGRLFAQPALRQFERVTTLTLQTPLDEIQRRWGHRYPNGMPEKCHPLLAEKDRLITDRLAARPTFVAIHAAWERHKLALARRGRLAGEFRAQSTIPPAMTAAPCSALHVGHAL